VRNPTKILLIAAALLLLFSCGQRKKRQAEEPEPVRAFPTVEIPSIYTEAEDILAYRTEHYWDAYFAGTGKTDTSLVLGVPKLEVEQALANYIGMLDYVPLDKAQYGMQKMFLNLESAQRRDTSNHVYLAITDMVSKYLYDPNSPLRNEDYYQPFVAAMSQSDLTPDNIKAAYGYQAFVTGLNRRGTVAADFAGRSLDGKNFTLHGIKADYTLLFFSNPGCHACKEIIENLISMPNLDGMIESGKLAVVNIYIDEDLEAWKQYEYNYPRNWYNGYNPGQTIRNEQLYDVRAIPSLYLLDKDKKVIFKDAPVEKVLPFIENLK